MTEPARGYVVRASLALGSLLLLTACNEGINSGTESNTQGSNRATTMAQQKLPTSRSSLPVLATAEPREAEGQRIDIHRMVADPNGFAVLYWSITNTSNAVQGKAFPPFDDVNAEHYKGVWSSEVNVVVPAQSKRYQPLSDTAESCLCGEFSDTSLSPGETWTFYQSYYLPQDAKQVTVEFPGFAPVKGVRVQR